MLHGVDSQAQGRFTIAILKLSTEMSSQALVFGVHITVCKEFYRTYLKVLIILTYLHYNMWRLLGLYRKVDFVVIRYF